MTLDHIAGPDSDTSASLVQIAKKLFSQKGYDAVSVREIGESAGVNPALINYHFKGKLGLYRAIIEDFGRQRLNQTELILKGAKTKDEFKMRIEMFIEDAIQAYICEPETHQIMHRECDLDMPVAEDIFKSTLFSSFETIVKFFEEGHKKGFLAKERNPKIQTMIFINVLIGFLQKDKSFKKLLGVSISNEEYRSDVVREITETLF